MPIELLKDFRSKDFPEQINILQTIENEHLLDAIEDLCRLVTDPIVDDSVDFMIDETLRKLLPDREDQLVACLQSGDRELVKLCLQIASDHAFDSAGDALLELAESNAYPDMLLDMLSALARIRKPEYLHMFRRHARHTNTLIAALSIDMLGKYRDRESLDLLCGIIETAESDESCQLCSLATVKAIELLGAMDDSRATAFLCSMLYHRNPTARRLVQAQLIKKGPAAVPCIVAVFDTASINLKTMAARVLGIIGAPSGAGILVQELTRHKPSDHNLLYAIYDALGSMPTPQGTACLLDALQADDSLLLMAVLKSLDRACGPQVVERIKAFAAQHPERREALLAGIAAAGAVELFEALYADRDWGDRLIDIITELNDSEVMADFYIKLQFMVGNRAERDAARLEHSIIQDTDRTILAVDDSSALLQFYRKVAAKIGTDIITADSSHEALAYLEKSKKADLIIVSLDMPIMDGMEFSRAVRDRLSRKDIPILLTTTGSEDALGTHHITGGKIAVLQKPFTEEVLKEKLLGLLPQ